MAIIELSSADNGGTVKVELGGQVTIHLAENPATGYTWAIEQMDEGRLEVLHDEHQQATGGGYGAGGVHTWRLMVCVAGMTHLALKLWREWEGEEGVIERYEVTLEVL
jgi:inhibitor of cysteine peptidase